MGKLTSLGREEKEETNQPSLLLKRGREEIYMRAIVMRLRLIDYYFHCRFVIQYSLHIIWPNHVISLDITTLKNWNIYHTYIPLVATHTQLIHSSQHRQSQFLTKEKEDEKWIRTQFLCPSINPLASSKTCAYASALLISALKVDESACTCGFGNGVLVCALVLDETRRDEMR